MKVETRKAHFINGKELRMVGENKGVSIYHDKENETAYITNSKGEVVFKIWAECSQNFAFLDCEKVN